MTAHGTPEVTKGALDLGAYEVMDKLFELHAIEPLLLKLRLWCLWSQPISILAMRPIDEPTHD